MKDNNHTLDVPETIGEFTDSFKRIQTDVSELLGLAREKAQIGLESIGQTACDTSRQAVDQTKATISANPLRSAGIALAVGALIGWLISRR